MSSYTAAGSARRPPRHLHDPGARRILVLIGRAGPKLKRHARAIASATHAQPGSKPMLGGPKPDAAGLLRAIGDFRADLQSLRSKIKGVKCHTAAGRHGKELMLQALVALDEAVNTFSMAVRAPDRTTKGTLMQKVMRFQGQAKAAKRAALPLLER